MPELNDDKYVIDPDFDRVPENILITLLKN